jgi:hypothetical protein
VQRCSSTPCRPAPRPPHSGREPSRHAHAHSPGLTLHGPQAMRFRIARMVPGDLCFRLVWQPRGFVPPVYFQLAREIESLPSRQAAESLSVVGVRTLVVHTDRLPPANVLRWRQADLAESSLGADRRLWRRCGRQTSDRGIHAAARPGVYCLPPPSHGRELTVKRAGHRRRPANVDASATPRADRSTVRVEGDAERHAAHPAANVAIPVGRPSGGI